MKFKTYTGGNITNGNGKEWRIIHINFLNREWSFTFKKRIGNGDDGVRQATPFKPYAPGPVLDY
jgi:hypothetical protein